MLQEYEPSQCSSSIIARIGQTPKIDPFESGLSYALNNNVFPLLHINAILKANWKDPRKNLYKKTVDESAVKFVINYLDECWLKQKFEQHEIGYFVILEKYNKFLSISSWSEEQNLMSRMDLCYILRYLQRSGVYNDDFFQQVWKLAPPDVKFEIEFDID